GAAGGGELSGAAVEERSKESEASFFGAAGGSGVFSATSSGATISTAMGSAVTEPKGCTSANKTTSISNDRWTIADAMMPERRICRGSTVLDQFFDAVPALK